MKSLTYVALEGVITLRAEVNTVHWFTDMFEPSLPATNQQPFPSGRDLVSYHPKAGQL